MALPLPQGLVPTEVAFLCEMELVTVVPRQRLESIDLLTVRTDIPNPMELEPNDWKVRVLI
jgi:GINS complex subunit 2